MNNPKTMKIYITKTSPMDFVLGGYTRFTVWLGAKPVFKPHSSVDENGNTRKEIDWEFGRWVGGEGAQGSMSAKIFFTGAKESPILKDMWRKVMDSYSVIADDSQDIYGDVRNAYYEAANDLPPDPHWSKKQTQEQAVASFLYGIEGDKVREQAVEHKGQGWREFVLEYDIEFAVSVTEEGAPHNAFLTKEYSSTGYALSIGKDTPYFRHAMIIDPAFSNALKKEDVRPSRYEMSARTAPLPIIKHQSHVREVLVPVVDKAFVSGISRGVVMYQSLVKEFVELHQSLADNVKTGEDYFAFIKMPELVDYSKIDLIDEDENLVWFGDATPNELANHHLEMMASCYASSKVDAKGHGFHEWVKPVQVNLIWEAPETSN